MPNPLFWWLWSECSPLPIPNREVKPHIADDTALVCGKVGRRQSSKEEFHQGTPFFYPMRFIIFRVFLRYLYYERINTDRGPFEG